MITHRLALIAGVAAAVVLAGAAGIPASASVPAGASVAGWSITPSPNPRAGNGLLQAVSCPTTSACTAVGLHVRQSGLGVTLAERRSGGVWTVQSTPNPSGAAASALNGVSCPSGSACTAVGQFFVKSGAELTLAERWDGSKWAIHSIPNPPGARHSFLAAVACASPSSCTAVGGRDTSAGAGLPLAEQWNGRNWHITRTPNPVGSRFSFLNDVSCTAPWSCIAVGAKTDAFGNPLGTVAERWDGARWVIQPAPTSAQAGAGLRGVACTAPSSCTAVGGLNQGPLAERWDGTRWSVQPVPAPAGAQFAQLNSVSCAVSSCEAVGGYLDSSGAFVPLGEGWNGAAWHAQPAPNPGRASINYLQGVSCPSPSDCTAVGLGNGFGAGTPITLGERWNGTRWNLEAVPSPIGAAANLLNGIACPATDACVAVGTAGPTRGIFSAEALRWNGRAWHLQQIPTLPGANLNAVSCVTETDCVAVGGSNAGTLAEHWDGKHWTVQPTPKPSGAPAPAFFAVSCATASSCMAVGTSNATGTGGQFVVAEHWDGHAWRVVPAEQHLQRGRVPNLVGLHRGRRLGRRLELDRDVRRAVERQQLAGPAHAHQEHPGRLPGQRLVQVADRLHHDRRHERRHAGRTAQRDHLARAAHPHPAGHPRRRHRQRVLHLAIGLHRHRASFRSPSRLSPADPRGAVERGAVAHPAHPASSRSWRHE